MMTDLSLYRQYLVSLRQRELMAAHSLTLVSESANDYPKIRGLAMRANLLDELIRELLLLERSPEEFIKRLRTE